MQLFNNETNNNLTYPTIPKVISTKDLSYMKDMVSWNSSSAKKMDTYAQQVECEQLRKTFEKASATNKKNLEQLLNVLKAHEGGFQH